jgi:16S rRNA (guanine527-N7)-methyltransferase
MNADASLVFKYFPQLTSTQRSQLIALKELYQDWNSKINVVSRKDIDLLYERHVLHSLGIAKVIDFRKNTDVLDVGTGGGFPGIPLAILFPAANFHLVDSIGKKIKVVPEVTTALELKNVVAEQNRAEQLEKKYDFVVSRAVTDLSVFYGWIVNKFKKTQHNALPNGILYLKGGDLNEEIKPFKKRITVYDLKDYFEGEFFETKKVIYLPGN